MEPKALVLLAQGCEEIEAVTVIDILRRAGVEVTSAGLDRDVVVASRKTVLVPDAALGDVLHGDYAMVVLPGGLPGADNLAGDERVLELLRRLAAAGKYVCAICAAPAVLAKAGLLDGRRGTAYPGHLDNLPIRDFTYTGESVTCDGRIITSRGAGTAMDFALTLVEALKGMEIRNRVEKALVR